MRWLLAFVLLAGVTGCAGEEGDGTDKALEFGAWALDAAGLGALGMGVRLAKNARLEASKPSRATTAVHELDRRQAEDHETLREIQRLLMERGVMAMGDDPP